MNLTLGSGGSIPVETLSSKRIRNPPPLQIFIYFTILKFRNRNYLRHKWFFFHFFMGYKIYIISWTWIKNSGRWRKKNKKIAHLQKLIFKKKTTFFKNTQLFYCKKILTVKSNKERNNYTKNNNRGIIIIIIGIIIII